MHGVKSARLSRDFGTSARNERTIVWSHPWIPLFHLWNRLTLDTQHMYILSKTCCAYESQRWGVTDVILSQAICLRTTYVRVKGKAVKELTSELVWAGVVQCEWKQTHSLTHSLTSAHLSSVSVEIWYFMTLNKRSYSSFSCYLSLSYRADHSSNIDHANTRWFKYDRDKLWLVYTQSVPVIFEPPCT
jgi:hypothetical protein